MSTSDILLPSEIGRYLGDNINDRVKYLHLNVRSAKNKFSELTLLFKQFGFLFDVIMFSETWYTNETAIFELPIYNIHVINRNSRRGGGVSLLIKKNFEPLTDYCIVNRDYEVLSFVTNNTIIAVFYRPPEGNIATFLNFLEVFLEYDSSNRYEIVWGGDFNINLLEDSVHKCDMESLLAVYGCTNQIATPPRETETSETLLDIFITNAETSSTKPGAMSCAISDHLPV